jgi:replication factor C subunit 3/5
MLWVDKHRPTELSQLDYHEEVSDRLASLARNPASFPHLFLYGPSGAGKRTRISALLGELFGPSAHKLRLDQRTFQTPTKKTIELHMITSNHHVELSPGDAGIHDRFVIQDVLKQLASTKNIRSSVANQQIDKENQENHHNSHGAAGAAEAEIKVVVLNQVDRLSKQAQAALRRTMEKYAATCRLILCCDCPSKLIGPLRSRCLGVRISAPTVDQITKVLHKVAKKESIHLPDALAVNIAQESNRNLRKALLMLEAAKVQAAGRALSDQQNIPATDWEVYIKELARDICLEQSPQKLLVAREKLYELLVNCIPPTTIMKRLVQELLPKLPDEDLKVECIEWAAFYEHRIAQGSKEIFHLEAFVAKFMSIYKKTVLNMWG